MSVSMTYAAIQTLTASTEHLQARGLLSAIGHGVLVIVLVIFFIGLILGLIIGFAIGRAVGRR